MRPPDTKDRAALIVATICFAGLLVWPKLTLVFGIIGASVLFVALARQWL